MSEARKGRRGKARSFNFDAIEHVGNDADAGGFLGDAEAEQERQGASSATVAVTPEPPPEQPAPEPTAATTKKATPAPMAVPQQSQAAPASAPPAAPAEEAAPDPEPVSADTASAQAPKGADETASATPASSAQPEVAQTHAAATETPVEGEGKEERAARAPASTEAGTVGSTLPATSRRRVNDSPPTFSALSAEPVLEPRPKKKKGKATPAQDAVVQGFLSHRTAGGWPMWSGRMLTETKIRLQQRADKDAVSSRRPRLKPGHYLDAALRQLPDEPAAQAALANEWLVRRWGGEHPPGTSAQMSVSPEVHAFLANLKRSLRGHRAGIVIDVVCAAADVFLDQLDEEGPLAP
ncbi:hypothetical protein ACWGH5_36960 [Streptomyces sp. NPDC054864]